MNTTQSRMKQGAITRVEIVLAVLTLGFLAATVCPKVFARRPYAGRTAAMAQIASFRTALDAFREDNGYFPAGTNALLALLRQPPAATNWHGPYLDRIPQDPWDRDYIYEYPGKHTESGDAYDLISLGPPGKNSPIVNWKLPSTSKSD